MWVGVRKMKTVEVRSLLSDEPREVKVEEQFQNAFKTWYELFVKRTNKEPTLIDVFYAGYVLANPSVRNMFRVQIKEKRKNDYS